jgi:hypothetical protein
MNNQIERLAHRLNSEELCVGQWHTALRANTIEAQIKACEARIAYLDARVLDAMSEGDDSEWISYLNTLMRKAVADWMMLRGGQSIRNAYANNLALIAKEGITTFDGLCDFFLKFFNQLGRASGVQYVRFMNVDHHAWPDHFAYDAEVMMRMTNALRVGVADEGMLVLWRENCYLSDGPENIVRTNACWHLGHKDKCVALIQTMWDHLIL